MLYDLAYALLLVAAFPWLLYQRLRHGKYRDGFGAKFFGRVVNREGAKPCAWFHAVSVGEVMLLGRLINEFRQAHPDWDIAITSTTSTGFELAKKRYPDCRVSYAPLDFSWAVAESMRRLRPDLLVLAELELWPNLLDAADRRHIPIAIVNGRLSEKSFRGYRRIKLFAGQWLKSLDWIGVQTHEYAERFHQLGASSSKVSVTGSLKFDRAELDRGNARTTELRRLIGLSEGTPVWVVGSTQSPEERLAWNVYRVLRREFPELRLIIVPRHQERFDEVARELEGLGANVVRRSRIESSDSPQAQQWREQPDAVLLVDTIGELGAWWGTASVAFVGGSLGSRGGQNMIEPSAYGAAVSFGPETRNFRDVVQMLLDDEAAVVVHNAEEMQTFVGLCLREPKWAQELGARAREIVIRQQGATRKTLEGLDRLIQESLTLGSTRGKSTVTSSAHRAA